MRLGEGAHEPPTRDPWPSELPEPTKEHRILVAQMRARARRGWYIGDMETLARFAARRVVRGAVNTELAISLLLSRDKMHHSVGWWRNADYEYCWHLSMAAKVWDPLATEQEMSRAEAEQVPRDEVRYWSRLIFGDYVTMLWNEPGGTDPRLSQAERDRGSKMWHLRLFLDPMNRGRPFIPKGEVYTLTRWIDGLTPEKVDR